MAAAAAGFAAQLTAELHEWLLHCDHVDAEANARNQPITDDEYYGYSDDGDHKAAAIAVTAPSASSSSNIPAAAKKKAFIDGIAGVSNTGGIDTGPSLSPPVLSVSEQQRADFAEQRRYLVSSLRVDAHSFERTRHTNSTALFDGMLVTYRYEISITMGSSIVCRLHGDRYHPVVATAGGGGVAGAPFDCDRSEELEEVSRRFAEMTRGSDCDAYSSYSPCNYTNYLYALSLQSSNMCLTITSDGDDSLDMGTTALGLESVVYHVSDAFHTGCSLHPRSMAWYGAQSCYETNAIETTRTKIPCVSRKQPYAALIDGWYPSRSRMAAVMATFGLSATPLHCRLLTILGRFLIFDQVLTAIRRDEPLIWQSSSLSSSRSAELAARQHEIYEPLRTLLRLCFATTLSAPDLQLLVLSYINEAETKIITDEYAAKHGNKAKPTVAKPKNNNGKSGGRGGNNKKKGKPAKPSIMRSK